MSNVVPIRPVDDGYEDMPAVMSPAELSKHIGVSIPTLYRWRTQDDGPAYSQPSERIVRYLRRDVIAWLDAHRVGDM